MDTSPVVIPSWRGKDRRGQLLGSIGTLSVHPWPGGAGSVLLLWRWALGLDACTTAWAPEVGLSGSLNAATNTGHVEPDVTAITLNPGHCLFLGQAATRGCTGLPAPNCRGSPRVAQWVLPRTPTSISEERDTKTKVIGNLQKPGTPPHSSGITVEGTHRDSLDSW